MGVFTSIISRIELGDVFCEMALYYDHMLTVESAHAVTATSKDLHTSAQHCSNERTAGLQGRRVVAARASTTRSDEFRCSTSEIRLRPLHDLRER